MSVTIGNIEFDYEKYRSFFLCFFVNIKGSGSWVIFLNISNDNFLFSEELMPI